jgi:hypothetical protein
MLAADHDLGDDENSVGMTLTLCMWQSPCWLVFQMLLKTHRWLN